MTQQEFSYGLIPLRKWRGKWQTLLVKHGKGHWSFPKGHAEKGESPEETAAREFKEETGLTFVRFLPLPSLDETYFYKLKGQLMHKKVVYFFAFVKGRLSIDPQEISDAKWVFLEEAASLATFPETQKLCATTLNTIQSFKDE